MRDIRHTKISTHTHTHTTTTDICIAIVSLHSNLIGDSGFSFILLVHLHTSKSRCIYSFAHCLNKFIHTTYMLMCASICKIPATVFPFVPACNPNDSIIVIFHGSNYGKAYIGIYISEANWYLIV